MTDRERLLDILNKPIFPHELVDPIEAVADYLLDNGVTVQQWNPASQPPEVWRDKNGELVNYQVYMPEYGVDVGNYMKTGNFWLCMGIPCKVTHWMPLPEPPKEENE